MSTLKEKFNSLVPKEFGGMQEPTLTGCEQIADHYAIEFAEWCLSELLDGSEPKAETMQGLLEIFKNK